MISVSRALCWHTSLRSIIKQNGTITMGERYCQLILVACFSASNCTEFDSFAISFNSIHWAESRNRWMQAFEISNVRVRVEACILIVSSHLSGCDFNLAVIQSNRSDDLIRWVCVIRLGHGCSKFRMSVSAEFEILLNEYCWKWSKLSAIAGWKAWHYSSRKNINIQNLSYR